MLRAKLTRVFSIIFASVLLATTIITSVNAMEIPTARMYALNNILGYDGDESFSRDSSCGPGSTLNLDGNTNYVKIANYLSGNNTRNVSLSTSALAGVLANLWAESGYDPFIGENGKIPSDDKKGYGLAGYTPYTKITDVLKSDYRTKDDFNTYYTAEYVKFLESYSGEAVIRGYPDGIPEEVDNAWLEVQLDYLVDNELTTTKIGSYRHMGGEMGLDYLADNLTILEAIEAAESPEDAATVFMWIYERPADKEGNRPKRTAKANEIYNDLSGSSSSSSSSSTTSSERVSSSNNGSNVTIIGDSITVFSNDDILNLLPEADIHADGSKHFVSDRESGKGGPSGTTILKEIIDNNNLRDILVFALGTNDTITESMVQNIVDLAGSSRTVVFVTNYNSDETGHPELDYTSNNNAFRAVQSKNSNVRIADWESAAIAAGGSEIMVDEVHPNSTGTELFANTIYNVLYNNTSNICQASRTGATTGGGSVADTAIELAWPDRGHSLDDPTEAYRNAINSLPHLANYGDEYVQIGASCDAFVATVLTISGADPDAVDHCCGAANLRNYFLSRTDIYEEIEYTGSANNLEPGDILSSVQSDGARYNHVAIYVGNGKVADASHGSRTAEIGNFYNDKWKVFRVKD